MHVYPQECFSLSYVDFFVTIFTVIFGIVKIVQLKNSELHFFLGHIQIFFTCHPLEDIFHASYYLLSCMRMQKPSLVFFLPLCSKAKIKALQSDSLWFTSSTASCLDAPWIVCGSAVFHFVGQERTATVSESPDCGSGFGESPWLDLSVEVSRHCECFEFHAITCLLPVHNTEKCPLNHSSVQHSF